MNRFKETQQLFVVGFAFMDNEEGERSLRTVLQNHEHIDHVLFRRVTVNEVCEVSGVDYPEKAHHGYIGTASAGETVHNQYPTYIQGEDHRWYDVKNNQCFEDITVFLNGMRYYAWCRDSAEDIRKAAEDIEAMVVETFNSYRPEGCIIVYRELSDESLPGYQIIKDGIES